MLKKFRTILAVSLLVAVLAGCSAEPAAVIDPEAIAASLSTSPAPASAGEAVELTVNVTGAEGAATEVTIDVRVDEEPKLIATKSMGDNSYAGAFTFPKAGNYDVFLHLYVDDLHLTKKTQVEIR
ncbi:hypothetical protein EBB07_17870 [Paenibacillaceae bacterium]|nr:hypothetical protein EBB07_17870 [Paenibacillaceae bacterium]